MKNYIGVKNVKGISMTSKEAQKLLGRKIMKIKELPAGITEPINEEGYLVEYEDDYKSWSPKEVFEKAYREASGLTFGLAVEAGKKGAKIARAGWNGKNMYVVIMPGYPEGIEVNEVTQKAHNLPVGTKLIYRPYFQLYTAQSDVAMWSPSGSDALAEDWIIVN